MLTLFCESISYKANKGEPLLTNSIPEQSPRVPPTCLSDPRPSSVFLNCTHGIVPSLFLVHHYIYDVHPCCHVPATCPVLSLYNIPLQKQRITYQLIYPLNW